MADHGLKPDDRVVHIADSHKIGCRSREHGTVQQEVADGKFDVVWDQPTEAGLPFGTHPDASLSRCVCDD